MRTVSDPPTLVAQKTSSWCFAAAEVMVRAYYGLPKLTQYEIARASTEALSEAQFGLRERWELAMALDSSLGVTENDGENPSSHIANLVRGQWHSFNHEATGGRFIANVSWADVQEEIDNDRVFVVGSDIHYYVVFGYSEEREGKWLYVLDPWPAGKGGQKTVLSFAELKATDGHTCIVFGG